MCVVVGGGTSCWVKLNREAMKKEHQAVRSKRIALGTFLQDTGYKVICCYSRQLLWLLLIFLVLGFPSEMRRKASPWQRNLGYPLAMLVLLALTVRIDVLTPAVSTS